jgi:hypothetical protein
LLIVQPPLPVIIPGGYNIFHATDSPLQAVKGLFEPLESQVREET